MDKIVWPKWPAYSDAEFEAVARVIKSNQLFAADEVIHFEHQFSSYINSKYAIAVGNATQGLHLALAALDIGVGDEVIVTPYSWISTASSILMQNAIPIFADIEPNSLSLSSEDVKRKLSSRTKAIIYVHMFGYPGNYSELQEIAKNNDIFLIEDASHAHGMSINGQMAGTLGDVSVFSLHQRKSLSVGDGGIVCTSNNNLQEKIRKLRSFGHKELSYNYRMSEFAAALGQVGLLKLEAENAIRISNAKLLARKVLVSNVKVRLCNQLDQGVYYAVLLEISGKRNLIDQKIELLNQAGIPIRRTWKPLHKHPHFNPDKTPARGLPWKSPFTEKIYPCFRDINLPVANHFCEDLLFELEVHPPVGEFEISFAADLINKLFGA